MRKGILKKTAASFIAAAMLFTQAGITSYITPDADAADA